MPRTAPLTRRALFRLGGGALGLSAVALLAACGGATANSPAASAPEASAAPTGAAGGAVPASTAPSSASPTTGTHPFKEIEQGRTPDGFFFLGAANAPVTLLDYSDFL